MAIVELERINNITINELNDIKIQNNIKTDQLNEWKQKYEVNLLVYVTFK